MDPIADMLTRIRNAQIVQHNRVDIPFSGTRHAIAKLLQREGYIEDVQRRGRGSSRRRLELVLKYVDGDPVIHRLQRVSKPGRRVYTKAGDLPFVLGGRGHAVLSTSSGIMTDSEARRKGIGGELLFNIW